MKRTFKLFLVFALSLLATAIFGLFIFAFVYLAKFSKAVGISKGEILTQVYQGFINPYRKDYLTFLILGLDKREYDDSLLTDTILMVTVNTQNGNYFLFSVPRDLWLPDLKTKINALYYYGRKQDSTDGSKLVKNYLEGIFSTSIDYTLILEMEDIEKLINKIGGVEVEVERSFTDTEFPKDDSSGEVITVFFEKGKQIFDGAKALQFMRSRKSKDETEGNDDARQKRQKMVILALKNKLLQGKSIILKPEVLGNFYNFFRHEIEIKPEISIKEIASFWSVLPLGSQKEIEIPWQENEKEKILIPAKDPVYGSWILLPVKGDWKLLADFYHQNLP